MAKAQTLTAGGASTYEWSEAGVPFSTDATITVTPSVTTTYTVTGTDIFGCVNTRNVTVTVKPLPILSNANPPDVCSSHLFTFNPTPSIAGTTWTWSRAAVSGISPATASGSGNISETLISSNSTSTTVTYNFILTSPAGCTNTATITVLVVPAPAVIIGASTTELCANQSFNLTSSSPEPTITTTLLTQNFNGGTNNWTRNPTTGNQAWTLRGNGYYYNAPGPGGVTYYSNDNSQFYLVNSQLVGNTNFTSTLRSPQFSTTGYTSATMTFWHYFRDDGGSDQAIVQWSSNGATGWTDLESYTSTEGAANGFVQQTVALPAGQNSIYVRFYYQANNAFYWAIDNVTVTGEIAPTVVWSSNPVNPSFGNPTTPNVTGVTQTQTTTYTASYSYPGFSCPGQASVTVNTIPTPIIPNQTLTAICSGSSFTFTPENGVPNATTVVPPGTVYSWSAPVVAGITGTASGTNTANISGTLNNGTTNIINVVYNVTATTPGPPSCSNTFTVTVPVNPIPTVNNINNQAAVCSGTNGAAINFGSNLSNPVTYDWTSDVDIGFGTSGTGIIPAYTKINGTDLPVVATVSVTATKNGCTGPPRTFTITVNPVPRPYIEADYCAVDDYIQLTVKNVTPGSTFLWNTGETNEVILINIVNRYSVLVTNTYGCQATALMSVANELVRNGSFSAGNTQFTSGYGFRNPWVTPPAQPTNSGNSALWDENYYGIGTDARDYHTNFWGKDHTSGNGNFMIVNGNTNAGTAIWQQTVDVVPNTDYYFSAWSMSLNSAGNDAVLQFEVNGVLVGSQARLDPGVSNNTNNGWTQFYSNPRWSSGSLSGTITIRIRNVEPAAGGNDFGLDDISFGTLDPIPGIISPSVDGLVCQYGDIKLLANRTSQKEPFTYLWTHDESSWTSTEENPVISNANPANHNGTYRLTFTDGYNCDILYGSVNVTVNLAPICSIDGDAEVCTNTTDNIYTGPAGMVSYAWTVTGDGTLVGPANGQSISVTAGASCPDSYTVTLTITDAGGCSSTCSMVVSSNDTNKPVWTSLAGELDQTVECSDAVGLAAAQALEPAFSDLCSALMGVVKNSGTMTVGSCPNTGTITNTFTVTDVCGNEVEAPFIQIITINDYTDPVWTTTAGSLDQTVLCDDAAGLAAAQLLEPVATDNCGAVSYTKSSGDFLQSGCGASGTYTNTWIASDECGNTTDVFTQVISIVDNSLPTWVTAPGALDVTLQCDDAAGLVAAQLLVPEATDNCSGVDAPVKTPGAFVTVGCPQAGTYTNTWTVSDVCGNTAATVYTQTITIIDDTKPTWLTPLTALNRYLECSDAAGIAAAQALLPEASDNCDVVLLADKTPGAFVDGAAPCIQAGSYTNTFVAIDDCGNMSETFTQFIFLEDNTPPEVIAPPTAVILCTDNSNDLSLTGTATGSDNCGDVAFTYSDALPVDGSCPGTLSITRTWTATDACGNTATAIQNIVTQDINPPTISTPAQDISVVCDGAGNLTDLNAWLTSNGGAIASDDCGPVTWTNNFTVLATSCGSTTVIFTATDGCANFNITTATFTITDSRRTQLLITCHLQLRELWISTNVSLQTLFWAIQPLPTIARIHQKLHLQMMPRHNIRWV